MFLEQLETDPARFLPEEAEDDLSSEVIEVDPPRFIAFTWAWHNGGPGGPRENETRVTIEIGDVDDNRARMVLNHYDLGTDSARAGHTRGWLSICDKLEKGLA